MTQSGERQCSSKLDRRTNQKHQNSINLSVREETMQSSKKEKKNKACN